MSSSMKSILSTVLAVVLVASVGGSLASGTMAGFFDVEVSTENYMCAGTVNLEVASESLIVNNAWPCEWYSAEHTLTNAGTLDAIASVHITNMVCTEDSPGAEMATSEPEDVAENSGWIGNVWVEGIGTDACNIADFIDVRLYFDSEDDGTFELIIEDKLSNLVCNNIVLGVIPGSSIASGTGKGGGWGSYFEYTIGGTKLELPLMMGQNTNAGTLSVWTDSGYLWVEFDTTASGWEMAVTHVYVGTDPPPKLAPGQFPYKHEPVTPPLTEDLYQIPLNGLSGEVYIAAHTEGTDNETAWAKGTKSRFKIELHFPDIPEDYFGFDYFPDTSPCNDWPTNAYQGDIVTFDTEFYVNGLSYKQK